VFAFDYLHKWEKIGSKPLERTKKKKKTMPDKIHIFIPPHFLAPWGLA